MANNKTLNGVKLNVNFTPATSRENLVSGENISSSLGKINKYFSDMNETAFTGDAETVNGHTVESDIPANVNFDGMIVDDALDETSKHAVQNKVITKAINDKVNISEIGVANGIAELDSTGKIPKSQLPSDIDDIVEGYLSDNKFYKESTYITQIASESGKVYIDIPTSKQYRFNGDSFEVMGLDLGESSTTAYRGDRGKLAYDHTNVVDGNPHNVTKSDVGLSEVENKSSETIRSEITKENVTDALGYTPSKQDTVYEHPTSGVTPGTYRSVTVDTNGHVTDGTNPTVAVTEGGTGATDPATARTNLEITPENIGADPEGSADEALSEAKTYADTQDATTLSSAKSYTETHVAEKIADLINGAPETLDTLKEISDAMAEHEEVTEALNTAIGTKANASDLTSHTGDTTIHITATERTNWNAAKTHADSTHARTDATNVEASSTNGNIKINGTETNVYTLPSAGTSLGGVKSGGNVTISNGTITVNDDSHNHVISNIDGLQTALDGKAETHTHPYLPLAGGTMNNVVDIKFPRTADDRYYRLGYQGVKFSSPTSSTQIWSSSWDYFKNDGTTLLGSIGAKGTGETLEYYYIGTDYNSPIFKIDTSGNATFTGSVTASSFSGSGANLTSLPAGNLTGTIALARIPTGTSSTTVALGNHTHSSYTNQNAFSNVTVGSTTIAADTTTDTLTLVAGSNITLTADATNDKITIEATGTAYTHPTTSGNKHIPSGGSSGKILRWSADGTAVWGDENSTTYSQATSSALGLVKIGYTESGKNYPVKLNSSGQMYVNVPWTDYTSLKNPYALTIQGNGTTLTNGTYDGSVAKTVNITPSSIGAATSEHTHSEYASSSHTHNYAGSSSSGGAATSALSCTGNAETATTLETTRYIDGVAFDGSSNIIHFGTCSTAAATVEKYVSCTGFKLVTGARITVYLTVTNTADNIKLNVNGTGAKEVWVSAAKMTASTLKLIQYNCYTFYYDGNKWLCCHGTDQYYVNQANTTTNANYRLLMSGNANDTTEKSTSRKSSKLYVNPSTGLLKASILQANYVSLYNGNYTSMGSDISITNLSSYGTLFITSSNVNGDGSLIPFQPIPVQKLAAGTNHSINWYSFSDMMYMTAYPLIISMPSTTTLRITASSGSGVTRIGSLQIFAC